MRIPAIYFLCMLLLLVFLGCKKPLSSTYSSTSSNLITQLSYRYQQERYLLKQNLKKSELQKALQDQILISHKQYMHEYKLWYQKIFSKKKSYKAYPFMWYGIQLKKDLELIDHAIQLHSVPSSMSGQLAALQQDLNQLLQLVITMQDYQHEINIRKQEMYQHELQQVLHRQNTYLNQQQQLLEEQKTSAQQY